MSWQRIALGLLAIVAVAGFVVSPALGGPGFLTKKKANRVFLRKGAANRLFLSKAEAGSRFYSRPEADSRFLRPEGETRINTGPTNWVLGLAVEGPPVEATYFADALRLRSTAKAKAVAEITPELPVAQYGRTTKMLGAELCYDADASAELQAVFLEIVSESNGIGQPPPLTEVAKDQTPRTDNACRTYRAVSPVGIGPSGYAIFSVLVRFPNASTADFLIGRTSFLLQP
jgi:hypothetical protein